MSFSCHSAPFPLSISTVEFSLILIYLVLPISTFQSCAATGLCRNHVMDEEMQFHLPLPVGMMGVGWSCESHDLMGKYDVI